jgi:hypothetical protein
MLHQNVENIDLDQVKWRVRHLQGLLRHHRTKLPRKFHSWRVDELELLDRLSLAHGELESKVRSDKSLTKGRRHTLPLPAL